MLKTAALALAVLMTATLGTANASAGGTRLTRIGQSSKRLKMKKFRPSQRGKIIIFDRSGDVAH
jgi:hypothetical protein